jgi:hypothetical protein
MTAEPPAGTQIAPAAGNSANENAANRTAATQPRTSAVAWSSLRAGVFLAAAIVFFLLGNHLKPGGEPQLTVTEPTVTVLTNDPQFAGSVNMSLSASGQQQHLYSLQLTITPATQVPTGTRVEVSFGSVPRPIPGLKTGIVPSAQGGNEYFKFLSPTVTKTGAQTYTDTYTSAQQFGEDAQGGRLRVAFPAFTGETPGSQFSAPACATQGSLASGPDAAICASLPGTPGSAARDQWSVPVLQAGQSTLTSGGLGLAGYQYLAGDAPTLLNGTGWTWTGVNGATVLAAEVAAEDASQSNVFKSGIYLGVAASAAIALVTELLRPVWRKDPPYAAPPFPAQGAGRGGDTVRSE